MCFTHREVFAAYFHPHKRERAPEGDRNGELCVFDFHIFKERFQNIFQKAGLLKDQDSKTIPPPQREDMMTESESQGQSHCTMRSDQSIS